MELEIKDWELIKSQAKEQVRQGMIMKTIGEEMLTRAEAEIEFLEQNIRKDEKNKLIDG